jgi:hypothetical protein
MTTLETSATPSASAVATEQELEKIRVWVATHLDGRVTRIERQRRWRPVWKVAFDRDGQQHEVLFKSIRAWEAHPYPLEYELTMLEVLAENGIPVPPLFGLCESPKAIVMGWMPGGRDPGLVVEALENPSGMSDDRWAASLEYMEILARMHSIDPQKFVARGVELPVGADDIALNSFKRFHAMAMRLNAIDPLVEYCANWLQRNVPAQRSRISFVTGDCGQFLSEGPHVTTVLDMEIGYLGDHLHDLACFRGRHPVENMGDLPALFRHYEKALGEPLDLLALAYHTVMFLCIGYVAPMIAIDQEAPGGDWVESAMQVALIGRRIAEAMAEIVGVELDEITLPAPHQSPMEELALGKLIAEIQKIPPSETYPGWLLNTVASIPEYLISQARYRGWAEQEDLNDVVAVLGYRPADLVELDRALVSFVREVRPEHDAALIRFFHRRLLRQCLIIAGPNAPANHLILAKVEPILQMA